MRKGFTLIELMIVIAIIAIIAAIAIPNLIESRVTANEAAASATLKSGIFPAEVQWQAGGYQDTDGNNVGEYATMEYLAGVRVGYPSAAANIRLLQGALAANKVAGATTRISSNYVFLASVPPVDGAGGVAGAALTREGTALPVAMNAAGITNRFAEHYFLVGCGPNKINDDGRRVFFIAQDGQVRSPAGATANALTLAMAPLAGTTAASLITGCNATLSTATDLSTYLSTAALQSAYPVYSK